MEYFFTCPYCWEEIQWYWTHRCDARRMSRIEACCRPIEVHYVVDDEVP